MPLTLFGLISAHAHRFPPHSSTGFRSSQRLYFSPGGHTHDRHTIPPDRLLIPLSDPVLVAAEQRLADIPGAQGRGRLLIINDTGARKTAKLGSVVSPSKCAVLSQGSRDDTDGPLTSDVVNPLATAPNTQGTRQALCGTAEFRGVAVHLLDPSNHPRDVAEIMAIIGAIDESPGNADNPAPENSRCGFHLAPLASETFREELYTRGYLKRPASHSPNVVQRKPIRSLMSVSRKLFPKVLGRRQGRKVAECLRTGQVTGTGKHRAHRQLVPKVDGLDTQFAEEQSSTSAASVALRTPHADSFDSPGLDTNTSASKSFDLHEFSYITAFTTPPSSPSMILDAETFKKGADLGDTKHAV